jgi:uncharacterized damage-inducible protein DinB
MKGSLGTALVVLTTCCALPGAAVGQQSPVSPAAALAQAFDTVAGDLRAAAEKMPAEDYGFRPVDGVRSFGQILAHVSGGHFLYCSQAAGTRLSPGLAKRLNDVRPFSDVETESKARPLAKDELITLLAESIAFCEAVYDGEAGRSDALIGNVAHANEHYGNLVTYLRLRGIVPPSTERRSRR